ncbi:MAG: hypothetical protein K0Q73_8954, partial [Paenibacillus sp.]|nr:hypothetical protein [Paenibacillus sp.]
MRQGLRKWLSCSLIMVFLLTIVVGCSSGGESVATPTPGSSPSAAANVYSENGLPKNEKVTITFGFWENGYGREWIDNAIKKFTTKYPNVEFKVTYSPKIGEMISTKIAAKNDDDMFDIISPSLASSDEKIQVQKAGLFEDLSDLWEREVPDVKGKKLKDLVLD